MSSNFTNSCNSYVLSSKTNSRYSLKSLVYATMVTLLILLTLLDKYTMRDCRWYCHHSDVATTSPLEIFASTSF